MKTQKIILSILAILAMFGFSVAFLSLYFVFYEWTISIGFSFWGFILMMSAVATALKTPNLIMKK
jgi:hypothetical protein